MSFSHTIIRWYHKNKRDLPWRHTSDPYKIWLSEIILQQTRVQQGLPYYETFVKKFPTIHHLAEAREDVVMKTWQGLGYYSRARNLHFTAKYIAQKLKGIFPTKYEEIKKLKGIGEYTAAAIASFAFNEPHAVVDGNVFRVLSRYLGIRIPVDSTEGKKAFTQKSNLLIDKKDPGTFNQAIMEFGALQCVPQNPDCNKCPLKKDCRAYANNEIAMLPVKSQKVKVRNRYFNYFVVRKDGKTLIRKRTENDIWKNLYDFPMTETKKEMKKIEGAIASKSFKHVLSHQVIYARFWELKTISQKIKTGSKGEYQNSIYVSDNQLNKFAFPRLIDRYFEEMNSKDA